MVEVHDIQNPWSSFRPVTDSRKCSQAHYDLNTQITALQLAPVITSKIQACFDEEHVPDFIKVALIALRRLCWTVVITEMYQIGDSFLNCWKLGEQATH